MNGLKRMLVCDSFRLHRIGMVQKGPRLVSMIAWSLMKMNSDDEYFHVRLRMLTPPLYDYHNHIFWDFVGENYCSNIFPRIGNVPFLSDHHECMMKK